MSQEIHDKPPLYVNPTTETPFNHWHIVGPIPAADFAAAIKDLGKSIPESTTPFPEIYTMEGQEWLGWEIYYPVWIDDAVFQNQVDMVTPKSPIQSFTIDNIVYKSEAFVFEQATIDLNNQYGLSPNNVIYAISDIQMELPTRVQLTVVSDDAMKIWLNGELVYSYFDDRQITVSKDTVRVQFNEGLNRLCVKVMNFHGDWGFDIGINELNEITIDRKVAESVSRISEVFGEDENFIWTVVIVVLVLFLLFAGFLILVKLYVSNEKLNG